MRDAEAIAQPRAGLSPDCADPSPRPVLPPFLFQMNNQTHRPQADVVLSQLAGFSAGPAPALFPPVARPPQSSQPRCLLAARRAEWVERLVGVSLLLIHVMGDVGVPHGENAPWAACPRVGCRPFAKR